MMLMRSGAPFPMTNQRRSQNSVSERYSERTVTASSCGKPSKVRPPHRVHFRNQQARLAITCHSKLVRTFQQARLCFEGWRTPDPLLIQPLKNLYTILPNFRFSFSASVYEFQLILHFKYKKGAATRDFFFYGLHETNLRLDMVHGTGGLLAGSRAHPQFHMYIA